MRAMKLSCNEDLMEAFLLLNFYVYLGYVRFVCVSYFKVKIQHSYRLIRILQNCTCLVYYLSVPVTFVYMIK